jgi:hypothetical protein
MILIILSILYAGSLMLGLGSLIFGIISLYIKDIRHCAKCSFVISGICIAIAIVAYVIIAVYGRYLLAHGEVFL